MPVILLIFGVSILSQNALGQGGTCYNLPGCENIPWNSTYYDVVLPEFPTCTLTVQSKSRICNGKTQFYVAAIHFYHIGNDCSALKDWLYPNGEDQFGILPDPQKVDYLFDYSYENIIDQEFDSAIYLLGTEYFDCEDGYLGPINVFSYFKGICKSMCWMIYSHVSNPYKRLFYYKRQNCIDICCQVEVMKCWDSSVPPGEVRTTTNITIPPEAPDCSTLAFPPCTFPNIPNYNQGMSFPVPCRPYCQN